MGLFNFMDAADSLDDLLDREHRAILTGEFDILGRLLKEKERLVLALNAAPQAERFEPLKVKLGRNQKLLLAASKGIRAVSERLSKRSKLKDSFQTYDRDGRRHGQPVDARNMERRA